MDPSNGQLVPGGVVEEAKQVSDFPHLKILSLLLLILKSTKKSLD